MALKCSATLFALLHPKTVSNFGTETKHMVRWDSSQSPPTRLLTFFSDSDMQFPLITGSADNDVKISLKRKRYFIAVANFFHLN